MGNVIVSRTQSRVGHFIFEKKEDLFLYQEKGKYTRFF